MRRGLEGTARELSWRKFRGRGASLSGMSVRCQLVGEEEERWWLEVEKHVDLAPLERSVAGQVQGKGYILQTPELTACRPFPQKVTAETKNTSVIVHSLTTTHARMGTLVSL